MLALFDIDNTLINTQAKVRLVKDGKIIKRLGSQEHNKLYERGAYPMAYELDYSEFTSMEQILSEPKLAGWYALKAASENGDDIYIITARQAREMIFEWLCYEGINIDESHIFCYDWKNYDSVAQWKGAVAGMLFNKHKPSEVVYWEDENAFIKEVNTIANALNIKLRVYSS